MSVETAQIIRNPACHVVQFYDEDRALIEQVVGFLADGIENGEMVFVLACAAHRLAFDASLVAHGVNVAAARAAGSYIALDAEATMGQFLTDDRPDQGAFETTVGELMRRAHATGRPVRAYGEMVALLWDAGDVDTAIELACLWNAMASRLTFSLFCAYPTQVVIRGDHLDAFAELCRLHTAVVGSLAAAAVTRDEPVDIDESLWITIV